MATTVLTTEELAPNEQVQLLIADGSGTASLKVVGGTGGGGTVDSVTGTAPIDVGGTASDPVVSISPATDVADGSMSAADKSKLDALGENIVVLQPGGTAAGNVVTSWAAAVTARNAIPAPATIVLDITQNGGAAIHASSSAAFTHDTAIEASFDPNNAGGFAELIIDNGVTLAGVSTFINLLLVSNSASAVITLAAQPNLRGLLFQSTEVLTTAGAAFVSCTGGTFLQVFATEFAVFGDGIHGPIFQRDAASTIHLFVLDVSQLSNATLSGSGGPGAFQIDFVSSAVVGNALGAAATLFFDSAAARNSYDDTAVSPPLGATNVQTAIDALKAGRLLRVTLLTDASVSPLVLTSQTTAYYIEAVGGGGGGGGYNGASGTGNSGAAGGGAPGVYATAFFSGIAPSTSCPFVIGTGGGGGVGNANGTGGGDTQITIGATAYDAGGGNGGIKSTNSANPQVNLGGAFGGASGFDVFVFNSGKPGMIISNTGPVGISGDGGGTPLGAGGVGRTTAGNGSGFSGGFGGGGAGAFGSGTSNHTGGAGGDGAIRLWEFSGG